MIKSSTLRRVLIKAASLFILLLTVENVFAQSAASGSETLSSVMIALAVLVIFFLIVQVSDNLLKVEAKESGLDKDGSNFSIFPRKDDFVKAKLPNYVDQEKIHILRKGHDIKLEGEAARKINKSAQATHFAVQPQNFQGMSPIPKLHVEIGDEVKAGDPLFFDKKRPDVNYVAPVSGEVIAINRGEKRSIAEVVILADKDIKYKTFEDFDLENGSRESLVDYLLASGVWTMIRQRPYDIVADPKVMPKAIFVSTFDTAPLAPDLNFVIEGRGEAFQKGLDVLNKLTDGKVHLSLNAKADETPSTIFTEAKGVEKNWFHGKHPAGNVGVQIHHIDPINAQDKVWVLGVQEVITLGTLFTEGKFNAERIVVLAGAELDNPTYVKTYIGANIAPLLKGNLNKEETPRIISGDVLSGSKKEGESFLNYYDDQITLVEEGDYYELFGWLAPTTSRPSISKTFLSNHFPDLVFKANTNTHGEKRAFVMTGQYEKVLPMDIYPQHLMKSIIVNDFEKMEGLGIYELSEEDIALCEFVCTSKQPLQQILRQGLDVMMEQG